MIFDAWRLFMKIYFLILVLAFSGPWWTIKAQERTTPNYCPVEEPYSRSSSSNFCDVILRIKNEATVAVNIFWVDHQGNEVSKATVPEKGLKEQRTCMHHLWRARDAKTHRLISELTSTGTAVQPWTIKDCDGYPLKSPFRINADLGHGRGSFLMQRGDLNTLSMADGSESIIFQSGGEIFQTGSDEEVLAEITISLEEAFAGGPIPIVYEHKIACRKCKGTGKELGKDEIPLTCDRCQGTGIWLAEKSFVRGKPDGRVPKYTKHGICGNCEGFGTVHRDAKAPVCSKCKGDRVVEVQKSFVFDVAPGTPDGFHVRYPGQGHVTTYDIHTRQMIAGDLVVQINVKTPENVEVCHGHILHHQVLSLKDALHGFVQYIDHVSGNKVQIQREGFTFPGTMMKLKREGMPAFGGNPKGDLIVHFSIDLPEEDVHDHDGDGRRSLFMHLLKSLSSTDVIEKVCSKTSSHEQSNSK